MKLLLLFLFLLAFYPNIESISIFVKISWRDNGEHELDYYKYLVNKKSERFLLGLNSNSLQRPIVRVTDGYDTYHFKQKDFQSVGNELSNFYLRIALNGHDEWLNCDPAIFSHNFVNTYYINFYDPPNKPYCKLRASPLEIADIFGDKLSDIEKDVDQFMKSVFADSEGIAIHGDVDSLPAPHELVFNNQIKLYENALTWAKIKQMINISGNANGINIASQQINE
uniref:Uncharacterized protein n=1 Tax=Meloidogyne javanica TaxID=6303 RepID=A0A915LQ16_MELJA